MIEVSRFVRHAVAIAAIGVAASVPASAGHEDRDEAPGAVVDRLHHMGFTDWRRLKWAHGFWKVDDARRANGHVYDLKVEDGTFDLVRLEREKP